MNERGQEMERCQKKFELRRKRQLVEIQFRNEERRIMAEFEMKKEVKLKNVYHGKES